MGRPGHGGAGGFSLVELLTVIAVIAIIAAVAIPNLASVSSRARFAKSQKNAQALASVGAAARAAGYTNDWGDVTNAITVLTANGGSGLTLPVGNGSVLMGVSTISTEDIADVSAYLEVSTASSPDALIYLGPGE